MKEVEYWKSTQLESYPNEEWKSLDFMGYPNYAVSNLGRVKSLNYLNKGKVAILKQQTDINGYPTIGLYQDSKKVKKVKKIHRLVAEAFIPNPDNKPEVDHKNCIRHDNRPENLQWATHKENCCNEITRKNYSKRQKLLKGEKASMWGKFGKEHPNSIPITQLTKNGQYIRNWDCAMDVERELGINHRNISPVLSGKRHSAGGYRWMYLSEYNEGV